MLALGQTGEPWTAEEIEVVVAAYLTLLGRELRGERPSKAAVVKELHAILTTRNTASIERKMQNISAVLDEEQHPWIDGYKPLSHYQRALRESVETHLGTSRRLSESLAEYQSNSLPAPMAERPATEDVLVPSPSGLPNRKHRAIGITTGPFGALQDYRNRQLGKAGEEWVADAERESLVRRGRSDLAGQVVWVSNDIGDGAGYDIASFRSDGSPLLIEVKTTNLGVRTPFFVTRWEVEVSAREAERFSLYRVFDFRSEPHLYRLDGSISESSRLEPTVFVGMPR